jgi:hypothetical protein
MIVYYDPASGSITGMSFNIDTSRTSPFIDTDDELAIKIFKGEEKGLHYQVVLKDRTANKGFLKKKVSNRKGKSITERFYLIPKKTANAEFNIVQDVRNKKISITLNEAAFVWWESSPDYKEYINIAACVPNDLYQSLWTTSIKSSELNAPIEISYVGRDDLCFFTERIFESYNHEQRS